MTDANNTDGWKNKSEASSEGDYARTSDAPLEKEKESFIPLPIKVIGLLFSVVVCSIVYWQTQLKIDPSLREDPIESLQNEQRFPAPDIQFTTRDGKLSRLSDYKGKVVLISFWAHWCTPCLVELPSFKVLSEKYADKGLVILPLNLDEKGQAEEQIDKLWEAEKFPFSTFYDNDKISAKAFNVDNLPANFIVDRQGKLAFSSIGSNDWGSSTILDLFNSLVAEN